MTEPHPIPETHTAPPAPTLVATPAPPARKRAVGHWLRSHPLHIVAALLLGLILGCCLGGVVGAVVGSHRPHGNRQFRDHRDMRWTRPGRPDMPQPGGPGFGPGRPLPPPAIQTANPSASPS
jgi:hypothetical protein